MKKQCIKCSKIKSLSHFQIGKNQCKECLNAIKRAWTKLNPASARLSSIKKSLKKKFNLTIEEYAVILKSQGNCCAICGIHNSKLNKRLCVDHDHTTKQIRGLLCTDCNANKVGSNNIESLHKIINYFTRSP